MNNSETILVIKLGAFGDFVQAFGAFATIRNAHRTARIVLLTTAPYAGLAKLSPWFDEVWTDKRAKFWNLPECWKIGQRLRSCLFQRIYDLQNNNRTGWYFRVVRKPVEWSGVAAGCSHPYTNPERKKIHTLERLGEQLSIAGLTMEAQPDLSWLETDLTRFALPDSYALLCSGAAAHRVAKRWPAPFFAQMAQHLAARGITPLLIGSAAEEQEISVIQKACPQARSLCGQTSFADLYGLGRTARLALGNDTGPMHMFARAGCPSLVLFSADSDPALCAPRRYGDGGRVEILREPDLANLSPEKVIAALENLA